MAVEDSGSNDTTNKMKIWQMIGVHTTIRIDLQGINIIPVKWKNRKIWKDEKQYELVLCNRFNLLRFKVQDSDLFDLVKKKKSPIIFFP